MASWGGLAGRWSVAVVIGQPPPEPETSEPSCWPPRRSPRPDQARAWGEDQSLETGSRTQSEVELALDCQMRAAVDSGVLDAVDADHLLRLLSGQVPAQQLGALLALRAVDVGHDVVGQVGAVD